MSPSEMPEHAKKILDQAVQELENTNLSGTSKLVARTLLKSLKARRESTDVISQVQRLQREVSGISAVLTHCVTQLREAEEAAAVREPAGGDWWNLRRRRVSAAFDHEDPGAADLWVSTWMEALERDAWTRCEEIATLPEPRYEFGATTTALRAIVRALAASQPAAALDPIEELVARAVGGLEVKIRLGLLQVRILLRDFSDRSRVRAAAMRVVTWGTGTPHESLALAALAEDQLANDGLDAARPTLIEAVSGSAPATDALVLLGELHEREGAWAEADRRYDQALESDPLAARPALMRRVPARLLVRAAGREGLDAAGAVELLQQALMLGVPGDGDYPDKDVWLSKGDRLRERATAEEPEAAARSRAEAAAAYFEGGRRYYWSGYLPRAIEILGDARQLAPEVAEYCWQQAEALRLVAARSDGVIDRERLVRARAQFEAGLRLRNPGSEEAWVFLTQSRIDEDLAEPGTDPTLPLERALLLDPDLDVAYAWLASSLRRQGWLSEAAEAIQQGLRRTGTTDAFSFNTKLELCLDAGDFPAALAMLDERAEVSDDHGGLPLERASVLMLMGDPAATLESLADDGSTAGRLTRALALATLGLADPAAASLAREEFHALWVDTRSSPTGEISGWAAFGAGLVEAGIATYRGLAARAPAHLMYQRDLGQMLLVQGNVGEGRIALEEGIEACPYAADLRHLVLVEFPLIRSNVVGEPHAEDVKKALADLERLAEARVADLWQRRRDPGPMAVTAAAARTAVHADPIVALRGYLELAGSPDLPEAASGAALAATTARWIADEAFVRGEHEAAREQWAAVEHAIPRAPEYGAIARSLVARRLVADLVDGADSLAGGWLGQGLDAEDPDARDALAEAVDVLVRDQECLWRFRAGLVRLRDHDGVPSSVRDAAGVLLARLPVSRIYALDSDEAVTYASFLSVRQLEMCLGADVAGRLGSAELDAMVSDLRKRLQAQLGVRIPWVYHGIGPDLEPAQVDFKVYGRWVGSTFLHNDSATWLGQLVDGLDRAVRGHLFRLVGVDDIALWLEGWDLQHRDAPEWRPTDPIVDRLRLARLLRMLLREGASVADREAVLAGLDAAGGSDRGRESATLDTVRDVRRRLGPEALGLRPGGAVAMLPPPLEARLASGLADGRPAWELARHDACRLVADLRAWLDEQPREPDVVVVDDDRLRPFVWRLLADRRVLVLSRGELGHE